MNGIIESIKAYLLKGEAGRDLTQGRLIENLGLEGDIHAKGGDRQLSILVAETMDGLFKQREKGLCFSRFKTNIIIRGLSSVSLSPGARLAVADAILEITGETKSCHEECSLYRAGNICPLAGMSLFARVYKGGVIRAGDMIEVNV